MHGYGFFNTSMELFTASVGKSEHSIAFPLFVAHRPVSTVHEQRASCTGMQQYNPLLAWKTQLDVDIYFTVRC